MCRQWQYPFPYFVDGQRNLNIHCFDFFLTTGNWWMRQSGLQLLKLCPAASTNPKCYNLWYFNCYKEVFLTSCYSVVILSPDPNSV